MELEGLLRGPSKRCLMLAAHTDDEFAFAGTLHRLVHLDAEVRYIAFSKCEESVPDGLQKDVLVHECRECMDRLGLKEDSVTIRDYPVRHFPAHRQEILEELVQVRRDWDPDLVFIPCSQDIHQDHRTVYEEGLRAFKHKSVLGYELPQNLISFANSGFVSLSEQDVEQKVEALAAYESQRFRSYGREDFIRSLARVRGVQADTEYAEAFEVIRLMLL